MSHVVIIGNGIAGVTAARHVRKNSTKEITIISGETAHFFSRTALMYVFMGHMKYENIKPYEDSFWKKNRIHLKQAWVENIDTDAQQLQLSGGDTMAYDELIIATGSKPNKFGWEGEDLKGVQGFYSWQDLELLEENVKRTQQAVIVGGGLIGVELAEMLHTRGIEVTFLVREDRFWGNVLPYQDGELIAKHIKKNGINLVFNTELDIIHGNNQGEVIAITTKDGLKIACQLVGLTAGVSPNIGVVDASNIPTKRGVLVDHYLKTIIPNVYAIGDCAEFYEHPTNRKSIEQVWYTGKMMGETVAQTICGRPTKYMPGVWFNSAKFFDIEYQTYGWVWNIPKENEEVFCWQHPTKDILLKLVFDQTTQVLLGVNTFGIRMRHDVCNQWISKGAHIDIVIQNLGAANFDPELFTAYEPLIVAAFNKKYKKQINLKMKKSGRIANLLTKVLNR